MCRKFVSKLLVIHGSPKFVWLAAILICICLNAWPGYVFTSVQNAEKMFFFLHRLYYFMLIFVFMNMQRQNKVHLHKKLRQRDKKPYLQWKCLHKLYRRASRDWVWWVYYVAGACSYSLETIYSDVSFETTSHGRKLQQTITISARVETTLAEDIQRGNHPCIKRMNRTNQQRKSNRNHQQQFAHYSYK